MAKIQKAKKNGEEVVIRTSSSAVFTPQGDPIQTWVNNQINTHANNADIHITADDKAKLDNLTNYDDTNLKASLNTHIADDVKHITADERTSWNDKLDYEDILPVNVLDFRTLEYDEALSDNGLFVGFTETGIKTKVITYGQLTYTYYKIKQLKANTTYYLSCTVDNWANALMIKVFNLDKTVEYGTVNIVDANPKLQFTTGADTEYSVLLYLKTTTGTTIEVEWENFTISEQDVTNVKFDYKNPFHVENISLVNDVARAHANLFNPFSFYEIGDYNAINDDGSLVLYNNAPNGTTRIVFVDENLSQTGNSSDIENAGIAIPIDAYAAYIYAGGPTPKYAKYEISELNCKAGDFIYITTNVRTVNANNIIVDKIMFSKYPGIEYHPYNSNSGGGSIDVVNNLTSTDTDKALSANQGKVLNDSKVNKSDVVTNLTDNSTSKVASAYSTAVLQLNKVGYNDVTDNLTTTTTNKVLSANQGKILNETKVDKVAGKSLVDDSKITSYDNHITDTDKHVTDEERYYWNEKLHPTDIVDDLRGIDPYKVLSATMGRELDRIKVDKEDGKSLVDDTEITRLAALDNYDDTTVKTAIDYNSIVINSHTQDNVRHITAAERTSWNNKLDAAAVDAKIAEVIDTAPDALNTLNELSAALGDDPNFATTVTNNLGKKVDKVAGSSLVEDTKVASYDSHISDTDKHITSAERTSWNSKVNTSDIVDSLGSRDSDKPLSAQMGTLLHYNKIEKTNIADDLETANKTYVLSANMGKVLDEKKLDKEELANLDLINKTALANLNLIDVTAPYTGYNGSSVLNEQLTLKAAGNTSNSTVSLQFFRDNTFLTQIDTVGVVPANFNRIDIKYNGVTTDGRISYNNKFKVKAGDTVYFVHRIVSRPDFNTVVVQNVMLTKYDGLNYLDYQPYAISAPVLKDEVGEVNYWESTLAANVFCQMTWNTATRVVTLRVSMSGEMRFPQGTYKLPVKINTYRWCHFKAYSNGMQGLPLVWQSDELVLYGEITGGGNPVLCETHFGLLD